MSNPYGPTPTTLAEWNKLLGCCCDMPSCPIPEYTFRYKTAIAFYAYKYTSTELGNPPIPTDCGARFGKFRTLEFKLVVDVDTLAGAPTPGTDAGGSKTEYYERFTADLTQLKEYDPFTGPPGGGEFTSSSGTYSWRVERYKSLWNGTFWEWQDPGVYSGSGSPDGDGEWDWNGTDEFGNSESGTFGGTSLYLSDPFFAPDTGGRNIDSSTVVAEFWAGKVYEDERTDITWTIELKDEWTKSTLESDATTYLATLPWAETTSVKTATRTVTHPDTSAGASCTDEDHIDTWEETIMQFRPEVASGHAGDIFEFDWDWAKTVDGNVTLTPASWDWASPADKVAPWSDTQKLPAFEYGTLEVANLKYLCYHGPYGSLPEPDDTFPTKVAS